MTREIFFSENYAENEAGRLVPELSLFFEKVLYEAKAAYVLYEQKEQKDIFKMT